jgi:hypothetical protein
MKEGNRNWDKFVPYVLMAYRAATHSAVKYFTYHLVFWRKSRLRIEGDWKPKIQADDDPHYNRHVKTLAGRLCPNIANCLYKPSSGKSFTKECIRNKCCQRCAYMRLKYNVIINKLLECIKCRLITCISHFLIILYLVADSRLCHYCHIHSKGVIFLCCVSMFRIRPLCRVMLFQTLRLLKEYLSCFGTFTNQHHTSCMTQWPIF